MNHDELVKQVNQIFHDEEAAEYDARHPEILDEEVERWDRWAAYLAGRFPDGVRILDLGTGTGFVAAKLRSALAGPGQLVCADISLGMLRTARAKLDRIPAGLEAVYVRCDVERLPFPDEGFDVVTANAILHHLPAPERLLREIDRVLAPGGVAILAHEPNRRFFENPRLRWAYIALAQWDRFTTLDNYRRKLDKLWRRRPPQPPAGDLSDRVARRLRQAGLTESLWGPNEIQSLVDVNCSWAGGDLFNNDSTKEFDLDELGRHFELYDCIERTTYGYLREEAPPGRWLRWLEARLGRWYPRDGLHLALVIGKPPAVGVRAMERCRG